MNHFAAPLFVASKDHLARCGLQNAGYRRVDRLSDHLSRIVNNDHCPVIQVSDALIEFLAFFQNEHLHRFPGQVNGLERVGKLVDIEDLDAAKLRDLVQIEIIRYDLRFEFPGEFDLQGVFSEPLPAIVEALKRYDTVGQLAENLPDVARSDRQLISESM